MNFENKPAKTIAYACNLFRIFLVPRIFNAINLASDLLAQSYYTKRTLIKNISNWASTIILLLLMLHLFTALVLFMRHGKNFDDGELTVDHMF